jgi:hypothetical protein
VWLSYAHRTIALYAGDELRFRVLDHQLSGDFVANVGLFDRLSIGVAVPMAFYQSGDTAPRGSALPYGVLGEYSLPAQAIGDVGIVAKALLVRPTLGDPSTPTAGFSLALLERVTLPSGAPGSFLGEGHVTSETRVLASYDILALSVHGTLGAKLRAEHESFACASVAGECPTRFGHELPFGLAVAVRPQAFGLDKDGHWQWFVETYGRLPLYPSAPFTNAALSQTQVGAGARYTFDSDLSLLAGVDFAAVNGIGSAPVRGTLALGWAPRKHDSDDDGVLDRVDECPEFKEDRDGFEDTDGCPDIDNDEDGVKDALDRCDGQDEDKDGFQDDDGCPDPDNDGDGILDVEDHCPLVAGIPSQDPLERGCPDLDPDKDGVKGAADRCFEIAEDRDGFQDEDGCPDPDNDGDGVADADDQCRDVAGLATPDPTTTGCPDRDADGLVDAADACPDEKGVKNEDPAKNGCAEPVEDPKARGKKGKKAPKAAGATKAVGATKGAAAMPAADAAPNPKAVGPKAGVAKPAGPKPTAKPAAKPAAGKPPAKPAAKPAKK